MFKSSWEDVETTDNTILAVWQLERGQYQQEISIPRCVNEQLQNHIDYLKSVTPEGTVITFLGFTSS